ncbi:MAG: PEP/pyruvate-binding domain-containing protein [Acidobacteriota bacterium]
MWSRIPDGGDSPQGHDPLQHRYRVLRRLLATNSEILELMGELEADLAHLDPLHPKVRESVARLLDGTLLLAENLDLLTDGAHAALYEVHRGIERDLRATLQPHRATASPLVLSLREAGAERVREVGGKAANLGQVRSAMPGIVPPGFVVTTAAYRLFLDDNLLHPPIRRLLKDLSLITERDLFKERTAAIRALVAASPLPAPVLRAIDAGREMLAPEHPESWAVRSSAVGEDGRMSFAGQFDSFLNVPTEGLADAYRDVLVSRFSDRAVLYRLIAGYTEVDTPMAVLFLPMVQARAAGVLYTRDPRDAAGEHMLIDAVTGLADEMVRGLQRATTITLSRVPPHRVEQQGQAGEGGGVADRPPSGVREPSTGREGESGPLTDEECAALAELGLAVESYFGRPQDIEWVLGPDRRLMVVQARPLRVEDREAHGAQAIEPRDPILAGGVTIYPGRAAGPLHIVAGLDDLAQAPEGAIVVVRQATPELAIALAKAGGVIAEAGNPAGHAAALVREFALPALFGLDGACGALAECESASLDATRRRVFGGIVWPEVREQTRARVGHPRTSSQATPLHDAILQLNLTDPYSVHFRARSCSSLHDIVRYAHEKAVAAMFELGDRAGREGGRRVWRLRTTVPVNLSVLDLGGSLGPDARSRREVVPEDIDSMPFQALWRGMTFPGLSWAGRTQISVAGFASVLGATVAGAQSSARELGGRNYAIVGPDYLNLNARLAYHFAMIDAFLTDAAENNFVNFRFRGGAADPSRRDLRARFLAEVLMGSSFGVDRRGDLVTAWLRRYPAVASEAALETLGRLMACARQLDMLMTSEAAVRHFADRFRQGDFAAFA